MKKNKSLPPGKPSPSSGIVGIVGPRGGQTGLEKTVVEGKPLPPTPKAGQQYIIKRKTKHKND